MPLQQMTFENTDLPQCFQLFSVTTLSLLEVFHIFAQTFSRLSAADLLYMGKGFNALFLYHFRHDHQSPMDTSLFQYIRAGGDPIHSQILLQGLSDGPTGCWQSKTSRRLLASGWGYDNKLFIWRSHSRDHNHNHSYRNKTRTSFTSQSAARDGWRIDHADAW